MPDSMGYDEACMLSDMVPTGFHAAELAEIQYGDVVAVIGLGPVGLMALAAANLGGAGKIIAIDSRPLVWNIAKGYGADYIVDYKKAPTVDQVMDITHGKGVDKVLVAGGDTHIFETALNILRPGGIVANVNYFGSGDFITIPREAWGAGMCHKDIRGGLMPGGRARLTKLSRLIETGRLDVKPLITHHLKGFDSIPEALDLMNKKPEGLLKPVVVI